MPFGLKTAPAAFWKLMNTVFKELKRKGIVGYYLDDIIVIAHEWSNMLEKLNQVFQALRNPQLTLKPTKCYFGERELDFLGFRIAAGEIRPGKKVQAIMEYPQPTDVHSTRRFLGLAGFFRKFIQHYAQIAEPLTRLTRKNVVFSWGTEQEQAFQNLRQ